MVDATKVANNAGADADTILNCYSRYHHCYRGISSDDGGSESDDDHCDNENYELPICANLR